MKSAIWACINYIKTFINAQGRDFKVLSLTFIGIALALIITTPLHLKEYVTIGSVCGIMVMLMIYGITCRRSATEDQEL